MQTSPNTTFPVIDISPLFHAKTETRRHCLAEIRQACLTTGFFIATDTGISAALIEQIYRQSSAFFSLDAAAKQPYHKSLQTPGRGWGGLHEEPAYESGTTAYVESFDLSLDFPPDDPDYEPKFQRFGANIYPNLPNFQVNVDDYYTRVTCLGQVLLEAFAEMLELEQHTFSRMSTRRAASSMRLLYYPGMAEPSDDKYESVDGNLTNVGISAHTDFELLTIMHQSAPGLQFLTKDQIWIDAPVIADGLIVILDDGLEFLTNGNLQATKHRVPLTTWKRYSIILFHAADVEQILHPLPEFISEDHPPRYAPVTQLDHISQQVKAGLENLSSKVQKS